VKQIKLLLTSVAVAQPAKFCLNSKNTTSNKPFYRGLFFYCDNCSLKNEGLFWFTMKKRYRERNVFRSEY